MSIREERNAAENTPGWIHQCGPKGREVWTVQGAECVFCEDEAPQVTSPLTGRGRSSTGDRLTANFTQVKL